jgi:hypothetical protein
MKEIECFVGPCSKGCTPLSGVWGPTQREHPNISHGGPNLGTHLKENGG